MVQTVQAGLILRFAYRHFQYEGKFQNVLETLDEVKAGCVLLNFADQCFDEEILDDKVVDKRIARIKAVIGKLRRRKIAAEVVLPGLSGCGAKHSVLKRYLKKLYVNIAKNANTTIWVDDANLLKIVKQPKNELLRWLKSVRRAVSEVKPSIQIGLIAPGDQVKYGRNQVTANELAVILADRNIPLLAQSQDFTTDYGRSGILDVAEVLGVNGAQREVEQQVELLGNLAQLSSSPFHKSAEATQMQVNLNALYGAHQMFLNCFDQTGTAPRRDNIYLQMVQNNKKFVQKLAKYVGNAPQHEGIRIIIGDSGLSEIHNNPWAKLLWRMGLPVSFIRASNISRNTDANMVYVLTGKTPQELSRDQLDCIYHNGVMLDALAAETIYSIGLPGLLGCKVGGPVRNVLTETLALQHFAPPHYGHITVFGDKFGPESFRRIKPFHVNTKVVSEIQRKGSLPNTEGMVIYDNIEHNHRSLILPFSVTSENCNVILTPERQRHFREALTWLLRRRMPCFVENTPDLTVFYVIVPGVKRIVLALLNTGYDWAIDARIRFGETPFKIKRIRELNEQGQLSQPEELQMNRCADYSYIQLDSDSAVPPMQMTMLLLEG